MAKKKATIEGKPTQLIIVRNPVNQQLDILQTLAETNKIIAQKLEVSLAMLSLNGSNNEITNCHFLAENKK